MDIFTAFVKFGKEIINTFGVIFTGVFFLFSLIAIKHILFIRAIKSETKKHIEDIEKIFKLKDTFRKLEAVCKDERKANQVIESIWISFEKNVIIPIRSIYTYCNCFILIGFSGTLWGVINTFKKISSNKKLSNPAEIINTMLSSGLNVALYSSLVAAAISIALYLICSEYLEPKAKRIEEKLNERILEILEKNA